MRRLPLLWQIFPAYILIFLSVLLGAGWHLSGAVQSFFVQQTADDLEARARLLVPQIARSLAVEGEDAVHRLCTELGAATATRYTVVLPGGEVVGDTLEHPGRMDNHADRPEVAGAFSARTAHATRHSQTGQQEMMYVAVPVHEAGQIVAVVRAARPLTAVGGALAMLYRQMAVAGLAALVLVVLVSYWVSRRISRPLEAMRHGAARFARGQFDRKLRMGGSLEVCALARDMNSMAAQLDDRIRTIVEQRNEQQAVLASMVEGVLALDMQQRVLQLNDAAVGFLGIDPRRAQGRPLGEVVRKADLQRFIHRVLEGSGPLEGEVVLQGETPLYLQAHGTVLQNSEQQAMGVVVVLHDVTRLRRLERMRRDFVANVSHELKTPITAIKASVETLIDGTALAPEDQQGFLGIIARQADRLNAIIDDLLALSRIEQGEQGASMLLEVQSLEPVLGSAAQAVAVAAAERQIEVRVAGEGNLQARINGPLLEQALVNLLSNAIKYSDTGGEVVMEAFVEEQRVGIRVRDRGCGIAREHLPRLFERFYRVDKSRSRSMGGTGLGLAIVKHITQAHGGEVHVQSAPGKGSIFTIYLPRS